MTSTTVFSDLPQLVDDAGFRSSFVLGDGGLLGRDLEWAGTRCTSCVQADGRDPVMEWWRAYWQGQHPTAEESRGRLQIVDLFSGSGGLTLGFRQAASELGFATDSLMAVDQDNEALQVYARHHHTEHPLVASVSELVDYRVRGRGTKARFRYAPEALGHVVPDLAGEVDVLLAGPPCQGHSGLNNHSRGEDKRNELYLTVPAMALALDVPTVIIENVPGVVRDSGNVVDTAVTLFEAAGYEVRTGILRADRLGWPQSRRRFFLVASRQHAPIDFAELEAGLEEAPRTVSQALDGFPPTEDHHMWRIPDVAPATQERLDWLFDNDQYDLDLSERPDCHKDGTTYTAVYGRMFPDRPAPTITTGFLTMGRGRFVHPTEPRVITPAEAARLQGFPDDYDFRLPDGTPPSSLKLTKWIGDAVPMPLGHAAGLSALVPGVASS